MQDPTKPPVDQDLSLEDFEEQVRAQAGIRPDVWKGMMAQESVGGRRTTSPTGVKGRWQVTEDVAKQYGLDRDNPFHQATAAARYLKEQYNGLKDVKDDDERWLSAVARYYGGPGAVGKDGTVSNVSRDGYSTPAIHIQRVAEKMAEAARSSSPSPAFQPKAGTAIPQQSPAKTPAPVTSRKMKTESEYPVMRAPSDVSTSLFDWRSGGTQNVLADSAKNAAIVQDAQRDQNPQRQRERGRAVASGQNSFERGASQFYNAAAKGLARIPQGIAELSDLVGEYHPAVRVVNALQGPITGQEPQRLAPQITPYTRKAEAAIDRDVPVDASDPNWLTGKIPSAVGSLVPFVLGGAASKGSRVVTGMLGATGNAADIAREFDEAGGDPANRDKAIALAAATGLSEVFGVGKLLAKFGANRGVMQAAKTVLEEGGQEAFQQWANNLNAANVGAYDPNRPQSQGVGESAVLGGLLGGGLSGLSQATAARGARQPQAARAAASIAPAAPRTTDTNLNPDEVLTPATGAQPIVDPATGTPRAEVANPSTDAQVDGFFADVLGRKPNPAAEKAKVKAQEAQAYRQAAEEAAKAGDVGRQADALQEALQRETDPQVRLDLKAQLRALEPAPATRKLAGQRAPAEPTLPTPPAFERAPETAALPQGIEDAPTAGLTGDLMTPQDVKAAAPVAGVLGSLQQYKAEVPSLIAAGKFNEAKALIKEMDAFLKTERKKVPPEALSSEYGQKILKDGRELGAFRDLLANRMQAVAAEKAVMPAKAPRPAAPKAPKGPKVVTPKAEEVRKAQGVLDSVAPEQVNLIDNLAAMENRQGGIPPVEPVAKNVLPFEELAGREKAKVNKRANMSPVEYLKQASQGEGFRVTDSGEAEGVSAKDAKIVAFTNQNSQYGMNDAAVMLDEGGYFLPDGRRFTDQDVKEADVLDYLKQYGKQSSAGNTGGVDPRIAAEEAAYYEQRAASEGAPTTSTRLPSGLIAESRRPQPVETSRNTPDLKESSQQFENVVHARPAIQLGQPKPGDHLAEPGYLYRTVSQSEIDSALREGVLLAPPKSRGGRANVKHWDQGGGGRFYQADALSRGNLHVIRVPERAFTSSSPVQAKDVEILDHQGAWGESPLVPQPIETPRSTPDYRQKALDRINAAELPGNAKQRYRDWLEQGRLTDSDVLNDPDLAPVAQSTPAEQVQEVEMRRTGTDNAPVVETPKRATPPQAIPDDLKAVYGESVTPEQAAAIQWRREGQNKEVGGFGHLSSFARKQAAGQRFPLAGHPQLRELLDLPPMPEGKAGEAWQHTLDALADLAPAEMTRSSEMGVEGLRNVYGKLIERANQRRVKLEDSLIDSFKQTVGTYRAQFEAPYRALVDSTEYAERMAEAIDLLSEGKTPKQSEVSRLKQSIIALGRQYGFSQNYAEKTLWPSLRDSAQSVKGNAVSAAEAGVGSDVSVSPARPEPAAAATESASGRAPAPAQESAPVQASGVDAAAARLARLRAAAQAVPQVGLEEPAPRPISESPSNDRLARLQQAAQRVNAAFQSEVPTTPEKAIKPEPGNRAKVEPRVKATTVKPEPKASKSSGRAKAEPRVKAITVTDARNEIGAAAETDASKLRLGGTATNYREVYVQAQQGGDEPFINKPHYGKLENVAFDYRLEDRVTPQGEKATLLLEGQSDWAQSRDRKDAPFRNSWLREVFNRTIADAKQQGQDGVLLLQTPDQVARVQRWGKLSEKDGKYFAATIVPEVTPIIRRYVKELPELARKEAARQGVALETREVDTGDGVETLLYLPLNKSAKAEPVKTTSSGRAPAPTRGRAPLRAQTEVVEPRNGGYVRREENGRIYEIVKYDPRESQVRIKQPGSQMEVVISQNEARRSTIPDDVAKAEIGEAAKEGQPSQEQPQAPKRQEAPETENGPSEIGEGVRRAAEAAKNKLRKPPSQVEYRGSGPDIVQEVKNLVAALSGRSPSKLYKLPADQGKLRAEIEDVAKVVKRYAKARDDAGLPIEPELAKSLSDSARKIASAFQSGDQKGYQNARKAIDDAFVEHGVEAPSFATTRREALKTWEQYRKTQEAAGKPLSQEYGQALVEIEQRLRFANRDGDVTAYQQAKRDLNWLTQKIEAKEDPATLGDKILTLRAAAHFLNPKFVIRNVLSQPVVWAGDKIDNTVAATISKLAAAVRGKKSVVGLDDFSTLNSLGEGARLALRERAEGKSIDPAYGLHPHAFEGKAGRALENALFFINRLPDDAFYHGYFTAKLNNLAQRYKGSKEVSLDQIIDQAHLEANKLAMRDKNWVSENLKRMQRGLNRISTLGKSEKVGLGTLVLNYAQYPGSTLKRAMEHSPLGLIDVVLEARKPGPFRERNVINALSRTLTGSAFTFGVGALLGASGIMTGALPGDDEEKKRLREIGYKPYQLNVSALQRWFTSGFQRQQQADGDKLVSLDWAQPWAMLLAAGTATANSWNQEMSKAGKSWEGVKAMYGSVASFMDTLGDQSVIKNLTRYTDTAVNSIRYGERDRSTEEIAWDASKDVFRDIADDTVSSNVPVLLNQIRQYTDPVNRSTWAEEMEDGKPVRKKGWSGFLEETVLRRPQSRIPYVAENGIPGVIRGLEPVPGSRKQVTYTPQPENNNWFNAFLNPLNVSTIRPEDQRDRKLLDNIAQPRKKEEKKRKPIERAKM